MFNKPANNSAFTDWLAKPAGSSFVELECKFVGLMAETLFGYNAVILAEPKFANCLRQSKIKQQFLINTSKGGDLQSRLDKLPIASDSVDLVYMAHSLEYCPNPQDALAEAYRILRADGHLLVSMFNPLHIGNKWHNIHWKANFASLLQLKDWLALLGFDTIRVNHFGYYLPFKMAYVVEASKTIIPMTPIKPVWSAETEVINDDLTEPTT